MPELRERDVSPDAMTAVVQWVDEARDRGVADWDSMVVATVAPDSTPSARVVLLRGVDEQGFRFYTNFDSRKGRELAAHPKAAIVLHWGPLGRQVRAVGTVTRLSADESRGYWDNRPLASRLSAWASHQSEPIPDRTGLERDVAQLAARFGDDPVPLPPFWGGYLVSPDEVELWQHRDDRLHDRLAYRRVDGGGWTLTRLAP